MPAALRLTIKNDGVTSVWYAPSYTASVKLPAVKFIAGPKDDSNLGYYSFPSPQRTSRPGLPQQVRFPKTP